MHLIELVKFYSTPPTSGSGSTRERILRKKIESVLKNILRLERDFPGNEMSAINKGKVQQFHFKNEGMKNSQHQFDSFVFRIDRRIKLFFSSSSTTMDR